MLAVELFVLFRDLERRTRGIDRGNVIADARQVQGESALIGEAVERLSMRISSGGGVVLALIEKRSGLLNAQRVEVEADTVEGEDRLSPP